MTATRGPGAAAEGIDALELQLRRELGARLREFRVSVRQEGLVLHGRAPSFYLKQLAQTVVMRASRCRIIANEIVVVRVS